MTRPPAQTPPNIYPGVEWGVGVFRSHADQLRSFVWSAELGQLGIVTVTHTLALIDGEFFTLYWQYRFPHYSEYRVVRNGEEASAALRKQADEAIDALVALREKKA